MKKRPHGRKQAPRSLPSLAEACAGFKGFQGDENRTERMREILIVVIERCRRATPQPFYTMRQVALFFKVALRTIAKVYHRLASEGFLTLVRSSQTMIPARLPRTRIAIRGVVAMPIWMPAFLRFLDWRQWLAIVQEELARHRFAAEPVFFNAAEDTSVISFVDRVLQFNPDYILWFCPGKGELNAIRGFTDAGVPLLTVNGHRENFPARIYPLSHDEAIQQGLKAWSESGEIDEIIVPQVQQGITETLKSALEKHPFPHRVEKFSPRKSDLPKYLERLASKSRVGIIFDNDIVYTTMCLWAPEAMLNLCRHRRVITERHAMIPGCQTEGITIDYVGFSYEKLARRIARDLSQGKGGIASRQAIFHADWRPQISLAKVSQCEINE